MSSPVGPRGLTVLAIVGIIGLVLAVFGWLQRGTGLPAGGAVGSVGSFGSFGSSRADGSGVIAVRLTSPGPGR